MSSAQGDSLLARYVSNIDRNVYLIYNLPEEVIAVIFAYVSRSPRSFRANLLQLLQDGDVNAERLGVIYGGDGLAAASQEARRFHEKWVVGYGHSSVAEHAVIHVGVEAISRLASAELELANPFLSFTEYSQRYQRPKAGAYHLPAELDRPEHARLQAVFAAANTTAFACYEELLSGLVAHHERNEPPVAAESERARRARLEKKAFEDARYALTLATHTNLGLTGNGRALRDALVRLYSDPYAETTALADAIRTEAETVLPALLKYAQASPYQQKAVGALAHLAAAAPAQVVRGRTVRLLDWTGRPPDALPLTALADRADQPPPPAETAAEEAALTALIGAALLASHPALPEAEARAQAARLPYSEKVAAVRALLADLGPHDNPVDATHHVRYRAAFALSEANWHQLLRHCRRIDFVYQAPSISAGYTVPPAINAAGLRPVLERAIEAVEEAHRQVAAAQPAAARYLVSNAHHRQVVAAFDLWELYHLVNLRLSPEAQWDIRDSVAALCRLIAAVHPNLVPPPRRGQG